MSMTWVHMQFSPQSAGLLSPLQNCSGSISLYCDSNGAGGDMYDISSIKLIICAPFGATVNEKKVYF